MNIKSLIYGGGEILPLDECLHTPTAFYLEKCMQQTKIHFKGNTAYWKNVKLGTIFPSESTFRTVERSRKNIFRMFNGLGINEELLTILRDLNIKYIEVPFCGETYKTTVEKWLNRGIKSPYCSPKVDQQLILAIEKINLESIRATNQPCLFESV